MANCTKIIAVAGVSSNEDKFGFKIFRDLIGAGCTVYGANSKGGTALDREIYKTLAALPQKPELVITVVPPAATEKLVDECIALGVKTIWMQPGSESDGAIDKARAAGLEVTARACFMVKFGIW